MNQARGAGGSRMIWLDVKAQPLSRFAGSIPFCSLILGLTPQA